MLPVTEKRIHALLQRHAESRRNVAMAFNQARDACASSARLQQQCASQMTEARVLRDQAHRLIDASRRRLWG